MSEYKPIKVYINGAYVFTTNKYPTCKACKEDLQYLASRCEVLTVASISLCQYQLRPTDTFRCTYK